MQEDTATAVPATVGALLSTNRGRRVLFLAAGTVALSGLVLGQLYGIALRPYSTLVAFLAGAFLYMRGGVLLSDRDVLAVLFGSTALSLFGSTLVAAVVLSVTLDASLLNAFLGVLPQTIPNAALSGGAALGGVMVGQMVTHFEPLSLEADGPAVPVAVVVLGLVVFAASRPETAALVAPLDGLAFPGPLDAVAESAGDNIPVAAIGGALVVVGLSGLDHSWTHTRTLGVVLVAVSLLVAGSAVGNVYASVDHTYDTVEVKQSLAASFGDADVTDDAVELTVQVENPTAQRLAVVSGYAVIGPGDDPGLAKGPAQTATTSSGRIPPGETTAVTVTLPLSSDQAEKLRTGRLEEPLTMQVSLLVAFVQEGPTIGDGARNEFNVRYDCTLAMNGGECTAAGE